MQISGSIQEIKIAAIKVLVADLVSAIAPFARLYTREVKDLHDSDSTTGVEENASLS